MVDYLNDKVKPIGGSPISRGTGLYIILGLVAIAGIAYFIKKR